MAQLLRMPEISANMVEAVLSEWPLAENASFSAGDAIATVETDKAVVDVPAEFDGVLLRTLVEPGKSVTVGTPMAVLAEPGEDIGDLDAVVRRLTGATGEDTGAASDLATAEDLPASADGASGGTPKRIFASPLARRIARESGLHVGDIHGTGPGGRIVRDDVRKALAARTTAAPTPADASPAPISAGQPAPGAVSPDRSLLAEAVLGQSVLGESLPGQTSPGQAGGPRGTATASDRAGDGPASATATLPTATAGSAVTTQPTATAGSAVTTQPTATAAPATTTQRTATAGPALTAGPGRYTDVPHSRMRRAIATRLAEGSREAPVFTIRGSARVDALLALRKDLNEVSDVRISVNDLIVAAAARAHLAVPEMNVIWMPDAVRRFDDVDIAVAVATDTGLVTPVIRGVQAMTVSSLARAGADAVGRARAGRLRQDELEGGTLTVTNLGVFGTEDFTAVINPPQAAILAVGAARQEAVVTEGELGIATVLRVTLSVDHRPIDGATAARWMAAFLALLESPLRILV